MHGPKPVMLGSGTLTITNDTAATLNVRLSEYNQAGYMWVKLQTVTRTAGMSTVDVTWQPMGYKKDVVSTGTTNLTATGTATALGTADLDTAGNFTQYSLNVSAALSGSVLNFIHAEGIQIKLVGDTSDAGTVWVSVWTWSY